MKRCCQSSPQSIYSKLPPWGKIKTRLFTSQGVQYLPIISIFYFLFIIHVRLFTCLFPDESSCISCVEILTTKWIGVIYRFVCVYWCSRTRDIQESLPAWTQEAYRPPCSEYSFCCPNWVPPWQGTHVGYPLSWPGHGGTLHGYPPAGYTPQQVPPQLDLAGYPPRYLPHGILGNVTKHYGIWVPP